MRGKTAFLKGYNLHDSTPLFVLPLFIFVLIVTAGQGKTHNTFYLQKLEYLDFILDFSLPCTVRMAFYQLYA